MNISAKIKWGQLQAGAKKNGEAAGGWLSRRKFWSYLDSRAKRGNDMELRKGVLCRVKSSSRLVIGDVFDSKVLEDCPQGFSYVAKGNGSVVRILLAYQYVAVEAAHFRDAEHADSAE